MTWQEALTPAERKARKRSARPPGDSLRRDPGRNLSPTTAAQKTQTPGNAA